MTSSKVSRPPRIDLRFREFMKAANNPCHQDGHTCQLRNVISLTTYVYPLSPRRGEGQGEG